MNPPFHTDRKADPELGRRFIASAKRNLRLSGQLFLVANRHLPYEQILTDLFAIVQEGVGTGQFKTFVASKPRR
jgi:16S rRNA (guanine1207-N2)-methyltransferase